MTAVTRDDVEAMVQRLDRSIIERNRWFEEHAALYAADVNLEHRRISITKQVDRVTGKLRPTKTKRARTVDIEPALLPLIKALVETAGEGRLLRMPPDEDRTDLLPV